MRYTRIRDMLGRVCDFHGEIAEYYKQLSDKMAQKRVKMLLDYMGSHEKNLQECLVAYIDDNASQQVLDNWTACKHCEAVLAMCEHTPIKPEMSVEDVTGVAMDIDRCLMRFYREVVECVESETVREVFVNLLDREEAELRKLAINALGARDI